MRFGRTELQMPILTLGGMRLQETWTPKDGTTIDMINKECQANFEATVARALEV